MSYLFTLLALQGFYDGTRFHRTIPGFRIQGGAPNTKKDDSSGWGTGGPGHSVEAEFNDIHHERGILSMARSADPNSAGSQFFLMHGYADFPGEEYPVSPVRRDGLRRITVDMVLEKLQVAADKYMGREL